MRDVLNRLSQVRRNSSLGAINSSCHGYCLASFECIVQPLTGGLCSAVRGSIYHRRCRIVSMLS